MSEFFTLKLVGDKLHILDQTKLPLVEEYIITDDPERIAVAIERLEVRGAPAIGVAAGYGLAIGFKNFTGDVEERFHALFNRLASTRPTAVNLFYALDEMKKSFDENTSSSDLYQILIKKAVDIHNEDIELCENMAANGLEIFDSPKNVLTHCNTGQLATGGGGTAFYVIKNAFDNGLVKFVHADETRPLLQGSRLTAFELDKAGIPFAINPDGAAGYLMREGKVDLVITGADRIASNGDSANKIGTYQLAIMCQYHSIPFYIAAPETTIDRNISSGKEIKIEFRSGDEVRQISGTQVTRDNYDVLSPAFDITPSELISGIITDKKVYRKPYNF
ncbi:MAG: methylthioribose-1-phosphate isomerase [Melioribacteraceae bacterium]|nr:MAG: methylthioribose-1-phosphate isomerase [Melioribacteraceae bacterium]